jgi:uroporphyrinogen decarboxylase
MPHYRRITDLLQRHGIEIVFLDCDGKIDKLAPLWLDVGINTMFPFEVGTWHGDPYDYRQRFGRDMRLIGGFDKNILMSTPEAIEAEVRRLAPLVEEGGFIPHCDHLVPPYVPYQNYLAYLRAARHIWGHDCDLRLAPALINI